MGFKLVQVLCMTLLLLIHLIQQLMNHRMIVYIINPLLDHTSSAAILLTFVHYVLQMFESINQLIFSCCSYFCIQKVFFFVCSYFYIQKGIFCLYTCLFFLPSWIIYIFLLLTHADFSHLFGLCIFFVSHNC